MNLLFIVDTYPTADRNAADFRLSALLGMIAEAHDVYLCAIGEKGQIEAIGDLDVARYRESLRALGVKIVEGGVRKALASRSYAAVVFEWFYAARDLIDEVRAIQPEARVIIDTVDVVFHRLEAKARLTQDPADASKAAATKMAELGVYDKSDVIITVTNADAAILHDENPSIRTFTIPTIHPIQTPVDIPEHHDQRLLFIGSFVRPGGEGNADAMVYFCTQILPLIVLAEPDVKLRVIGSRPTPEILALASRHVEVLGFVPDIKPYLETTAISIAPLRFGGGMKGKIGEAMSFALPVVTTSPGIEGFGLDPATDAVVADTPREFADATIRMLRDRGYLEQVRMAGYEFIRSRYSEVAVKGLVDGLLATLDRYPVKRMAPAAAWLRKARDRWEQHVGWRYK